MQKQLNIGIIGLGFIGQTIIEAIVEGHLSLKIEAVFDSNKELLEETRKARTRTRIMENATDFDDCDIIVECADQSVVEEIFDKAIEKKKYFIPMSIGAFITNDNLYEKYQQLDGKMKKYLVLPSGAIGGIDCIQLLKRVGITKSKLITKKPSNSFIENDYVKNNNISLDTTIPVTVFSGNAKDAAKFFPKNVNVAARLALATLGPEKTEVEVVADPTSSLNIHKIEVISEVGTYEFSFSNNPSPVNPKTSWLAALSPLQSIYDILLHEL